MVWGAFSYYGVGKIVVLPKNETVNKDSYLVLLGDFLPDCYDKCKAEFCMQDGAPAHTATVFEEWFWFCETEYCEDWPCSSPDFSPIENHLVSMKRELRQGYLTSTDARGSHPRGVEQFKPLVCSKPCSLSPKTSSGLHQRQGEASKQ